MKRGVVAVAVAAGLVGATGSASATQIKLRMSTTADPGVKLLGTLKNGTVGYGWRFTEVPVQVYEAEVLADDGQPVTSTCLTSGARIEILDAALKLRGGVTCTGTTGQWQFVLTGSRVTVPTVLTAQLLAATTTADGRAMSPTSSNDLAALIAPRITDTSPQRSIGRTFPISGYVTMPKAPRAAGAVLLQKKRSGVWATLQTKKTDSSGRYRFLVPYGVKGQKTTFRVRFQPSKRSLWLSAVRYFTIHWV